MSELISRQAAIDAILHNQEVYSNNFGDDPIDKYTIAIIDNDAQTIAQLPSADRPQGEWIKHIDDLFPCESTQECSICHAEQFINGNDDNFCPNCGARMKGANDEF